MGAIDKEVNDYFKKAGFEENLLHRTGHGMGITGHEGPFLAEGYDRELEAGMMVSVEPGIYFSGPGRLPPLGHGSDHGRRLCQADRSPGFTGRTD